MLDFETFAGRVPMDERDLKKILITQNYPFVGLNIADKILFHGMDLNVSQLSMDDEIHVVPARNSRNAARKMVEDLEEAIRYDQDLAPDVVIFTKDEYEEKIDELLELRRQTVVATDEQKERLKNDSARSAKRLQEKGRN